MKSALTSEGVKSSHFSSLVYFFPAAFFVTLINPARKMIPSGLRTSATQTVFTGWHDCTNVVDAQLWNGCCFSLLCLISICFLSVCQQEYTKARVQISWSSVAKGQAFSSFKPESLDWQTQSLAEVYTLWLPFFFYYKTEVIHPLKRVRGTW